MTWRLLTGRPKPQRACTLLFLVSLLEQSSFTCGWQGAMRMQNDQAADNAYPPRNDDVQTLHFRSKKMTSEKKRLDSRLENMCARIVCPALSDASILVFKIARLSGQRRSSKREEMKRRLDPSRHFLLLDIEDTHIRWDRPDRIKALTLGTPNKCKARIVGPNITPIHHSMKAPVVTAQRFSERLEQPSCHVETGEQWPT